MKVAQTFFKAITIASTTLLLGLAGCAFDEPIDYTTEGSVGVPNDNSNSDSGNDNVIAEIPECVISDFHWSNPPQVNDNSAEGTINGVKYIYNSSHPVETTTYIHGHQFFPSSYGLPQQTSIKNSLTTTNTLSFEEPISNPLLVFASIGNSFTSVPIEFSAPIEVLWSRTVSKDSETKITGREGYTIVRLNGKFSEVSFNYQADENWVNFAFGADFYTVCNGNGAAGTVEWTRQLGTATSDSGKYITTDESNNIIVLGNTTGHLNGDTNRGNNDFFVAKYNAEGEQLWTSLFGGTATDIGTILEVAPSGSTYVGGYTNGSLPNSSNVRNPDAFLVKFNAAGEKEWHHQIGSYAWDYAHGIAIDSNENVYLSGSTGSHYGDALGSFAGVSHLGRNDTFIIKYDSEGNKIWTKLIGTGNSERSYSDMAIDAQDNLYISGINDGNLGGQTGSSGTDVFVMKLDSDGNEIWTKLIYSHSNRTAVSDFQNGNDSPSTNLVLGSSGKIYLIAHTTTNFDNNLNMGGRDLGLAILDNNGNTQCSAIFGTPEDNNGKVIAVDNSNNFYIGYNSSVSINNISNLGGSDGFILKYDDNCNHVNTEVYGSGQDDGISSITFDSSDNLILLGNTLGTLNGDSNLGSSDVFIKKVIK